MKKETPISNAFIEWVKEQARDAEAFHELKKESVRRKANFLSRSNEALLAIMLPRLVFGREHYGDAIFTKTDTQLHHEETQEDIDAFVYFLIGEFLRSGWKGDDEMNFQKR